ncbi:RNA polymerase sigma factor [Aquisphaera insulae]|uniref:RNA polymerase sigma factor n=1 Tax=Aquisphaera insulae TaxID=2712864 RepID=UPI0013EA2840|nr:RNA polymerase sigma factor [Aquisphaera insulae]
MSEDRRRAMPQHLRTLLAAGTTGALTDGQLLERFLAREGEAAELAFATLVELHGPMVLRVCRSILRDGHAAHDAFQATFLVLARRARSLWVRDSLGPWLYQVAYRLANRARAESSRRRRLESRAAVLAAGSPGPTTAESDLGEILHEELSRLPATYRSAVVLCCLEGLTIEQAAGRLGWPTGTVQSRLARGRERLRARLTRRGLAPAAVAATLGLADDPAFAVVTSHLAEVTITAATRFAASRPLAAGTVPTAATLLAEGALETMIRNSVKTTALAVLAAGLAIAGAGAFAQQLGRGQREPDGRPTDVIKPPPARPSAAGGFAERFTLPGPPPGGRMEIQIVGPDEERHRLTLEPEGSGRFRVLWDMHGKYGELRNLSFISSAVEVAALDEAGLPRRLPTLARGAPTTGTMPASTPGSDYDRRLQELERKLDRVLKVLEATPGDHGMSGDHGMPTRGSGGLRSQ